MLLRLNSSNNVELATNLLKVSDSSELHKSFKIEKDSGNTSVDNFTHHVEGIACFTPQEISVCQTFLRKYDLQYTIIPLTWDSRIVDNISGKVYTNLESAKKDAVIFNGPTETMERQDISFTVVVPPLTPSIDFYVDTDPTIEVHRSAPISIKIVNNEATKTFNFFKSGNYSVVVYVPGYDEISIDLVVIDDVDHIRKSKIDELNVACQQEIYKGFQSTVVLQSTGKAHWYDTKDKDQQNFNSKQLQLNRRSDIITLEFKTGDTKEFVIHTSDEFLQISDEVVAHVEENLYKCDQLKKSAQSAKTASQILAIKWVTEQQVTNIATQPEVRQQSSTSSSGGIQTRN